MKPVLTVLLVRSDGVNNSYDNAETRGSVVYSLKSVSLLYLNRPPYQAKKTQCVPLSVISSNC